MSHFTNDQRRHDNNGHADSFHSVAHDGMRRQDQQYAQEFTNYSPSLAVHNSERYSYGRANHMPPHRKLGLGSAGALGGSNNMMVNGTSPMGDGNSNVSYYRKWLTTSGEPPPPGGRAARMMSSPHHNSNHFSDIHSEGFREHHSYSAGRQLGIGHVARGTGLASSSSLQYDSENRPPLDMMGSSSFRGSLHRSALDTPTHPAVVMKNRHDQQYHHYGAMPVDSYVQSSVCPDPIVADEAHHFGQTLSPETLFSVVPCAAWRWQQQNHSVSGDAMFDGDERWRRLVMSLYPEGTNVSDKSDDKREDSHIMNILGMLQSGSRHQQHTRSQTPVALPNYYNNTNNDEGRSLMMMLINGLANPAVRYPGNMMVPSPTSSSLRPKMVSLEEQRRRLDLELRETYGRLAQKLVAVFTPSGETELHWDEEAGGGKGWSIDDGKLFYADWLMPYEKMETKWTKSRMHNGLDLDSRLDLLITMPVIVPNADVVVMNDEGDNCFDMKTPNVNACVLFGRERKQQESVAASSHHETENTDTNNNVDNPLSSPVDIIDTDDEAANFPYRQPKSDDATNNSISVCDVWASFLNVKIGVIKNLHVSQLDTVCHMFNESFANLPLCKFQQPITLDCRGVFPIHEAGRPPYRNTKQPGFTSYETHGTLVTENDKKRFRILRRQMKKFIINLSCMLYMDYDLKFEQLRASGLDAGDIRRHLVMPHVFLDDNCRSSSHNGNINLIIRKYSPVIDAELLNLINHTPSRSPLFPNIDVKDTHTRVYLQEIRLEMTHARMVDPRWPNSWVLSRKMPQIKRLSHDNNTTEVSYGRFVFANDVELPKVYYEFHNAKQKLLASKFGHIYRQHHETQCANRTQILIAPKPFPIHQSLSPDAQHVSESSLMSPQRFISGSPEHATSQSVGGPDSASRRPFPRVGGDGEEPNSKEKDLLSSATKSRNPLRNRMPVEVVYGHTSPVVHDRVVLGPTTTASMSRTTTSTVRLNVPSMSLLPSNEKRSMPASPSSSFKNRNCASPSTEPDTNNKNSSANAAINVSPFTPSLTASATAVPPKSKLSAAAPPFFPHSDRTREIECTMTEPAGSSTPNFLSSSATQNRSEDSSGPVLQNIFKQTTSSENEEAPKPKLILPLTRELCKYYISGSCVRGDECYFVHPADKKGLGFLDIRQVDPTDPLFY